jgi:hypothetical protein
MPYRDDLEALEARCHALEAEATSVGAELAEARRLLAEARRPVLDDVRVAAPCDADWAKMAGDDRVRFCGQCAKNVYNLSAMTRSQAQELLAREGELCVRFYRRADGTVMSSDCAVGVRRRRRRSRLVTAAFVTAGAAAAVSALAQCTVTTGKRAEPPTERGSSPAAEETPVRK